MINHTELMQLLKDTESDRVERTVSLKNMDKFSEAICAFSNDFPNYKQPGYLIIGAHDKTGDIAGVSITDELLKDLASIRNNGQILPQPALTIQKFTFPEGDVAVVEVFPSPFPPVRFKGRVWIRSGPTKAVANEAEELRLTEKRTSNAKTFDVTPCPGSTMADLNIPLFMNTYLPGAIDQETLEKNHRDIKQQLASLRLYDITFDCPTNAGVLLLGSAPRYYLPGAYIQYVRFAGVSLEIRCLQKRSRYWVT